jgi:hypothetical protein
MQDDVDQDGAFILLGIETTEGEVSTVSIGMFRSTLDIGLLLRTARRVATYRRTQNHVAGEQILCRNDNRGSVKPKLPMVVLPIRRAES